MRCFSQLCRLLVDAPLYNFQTTTAAADKLNVDAAVRTTLQTALLPRVALCGGGHPQTKEESKNKTPTASTTALPDKTPPSMFRVQQLRTLWRTKVPLQYFKDIPGTDCISEGCVASLRAAALGIAISPLTHYGRQFRSRYTLHRFNKKQDNNAATARNDGISGSTSAASSGSKTAMLKDSPTSGGDKWVETLKSSGIAAGKLGFMNAATDCVLSNLQDTYTWITPAHATCLGGALSEWNGGIRAMLSGCVSAVAVSSVVDRMVKMSVKDSDE